jgi:ESCRT-II complex subunit VPS36
MDLSKPFDLNAGGAVLQTDEHLYIFRSSVDLYDGDAKRERAGTVYVTSHRLLWHCSTQQLRHAWDVAAIAGIVEESAGVLSFFTKASPKLVLTLHGSSRRLKLGFKAEGLKEVLAGFGSAREAVAARARQELEARQRQERAASEEQARKKSRWENGNDVPLAMPTSDLGKVLAQKERERQMESTVAQSFAGGLGSLVQQFEKLQQLVEECLKTQSEGVAAAPSSSAAPAPAGEDADIGNLLRDMGSVRNPVTRDMAAGRDFAPALARQVAAFIHPRLLAGGGLMSLTDVFCLYNRARGLDTVSPEDLLEAVRAMEGGALGLGLAPHTLPGGLRVLQLDSLSEAAMAQRALGALQASMAAGGPPYTTALALANSAGMLLPVAKQHLETAVRQGVMALDSSLAGRRYYLNLFAAGH